MSGCGALATHPGCRSAFGTLGQPRKHDQTCLTGRSGTADATQAIPCGALTSNPLEQGILAKLERAFALRDELRDAQVNHRAISSIASNELSRAASPSLDRRDVDQRAIQPCLVGSPGLQT